MKRQIGIFFIFLAFLVFFVRPVASLTVQQQQVQIQDCGFTVSGGYSQCGDVVTYRCYIKSAWTISSVIYKMRQGLDGVATDVVAQKVSTASGFDVYEGSYTVTIDETAPANSSVATLEISVLTGSYTCRSNYTDPNPYSTSACWFSRMPSLEGIERPVQCNCNQYLSDGTCGITDTKQVTYTNPTCGSGTVTASCNYCDPKWTLLYTEGCQLQGLNGNMAQITNGTFEWLNGFSNTPDGQFCCDLTGLFNPNHVTSSNPGSDCGAPAHDLSASGVFCQMDAWLGRGKSPDAGGAVSGATSVGFWKRSNSFYKLGAVNPVQGQSKIQPLVADFEGDGMTEILVYDNVGTVYTYIVNKGGPTGTGRYYASLAMEKSAAYGGLSGNWSFFGQPAAIGLDYRNSRPNLPGAYSCDGESPSSDFPPCGILKIALFGIQTWNGTAAVDKDCVVILEGQNLSITNYFCPSDYLGIDPEFVTIGNTNGISCSPSTSNGPLGFPKAFGDQEWTCYFTAATDDGSIRAFWLYDFDQPTLGVKDKELI